MIFNIPIPTELQSTVKVLTIASDGSVFIAYAEDRALRQVIGERGAILMHGPHDIGRQVRIQVFPRGQ